ncbi:MAG: aldolase catalytic domain-containing protein [Candidatus Auribacterota bacterium]
MSEHEKDQSSKGTWLTYRPEIKILDCTIRDGGLINNHMFEDGFVKAIYEALRDSGVDYMEMGYKGSKSIFVPGEHGTWKFCDEDVIRRIVGDNDSSLKISVMADAERTDYHTDILPKDRSVIDMIRVATYIHQIPTALDMLKDAKDKGYETTLNLMAISIIQDRELDEALEILADSPADVIYIVDSFGFFYSEQIRDLVRVYSKAFEGKGKMLGIHAHNNQQLAYANTIESLINGVNYLDSTINGMGRGAGNCPTELLLGFLKNPKYKMRPILQCIQDVMLPLQKDMEWGYQLPYMFTGQMNLHPREAIKMRAGDKKDDYVAFYDQLMDQY